MTYKGKESLLELIPLLNAIEWKTSELDELDTGWSFKAYIPNENNVFLNISLSKKIPNVVEFKFLGTLPGFKDDSPDFPNRIRQDFVNSFQKDVSILNLLVVDNFPTIGIQKLIFFDHLNNSQYIYDTLIDFINAISLMRIRYRALREDYTDVFENLTI